MDIEIGFNGKDASELKHMPLDQSKCAMNQSMVEFKSYESDERSYVIASAQRLRTLHHVGTRMLRDRHCRCRKNKHV